MKAKKNAIKRMIAICLTAIMTLAMATTAFAKEADAVAPLAAPKQGSLTVKVNADNTLKGQKISVYKLFDLSVTETEPKKYAYQVNEYFKDAIATALGITTTEATNEALLTEFAKYKDNSAEIQKFAKDFTTAALKKGTKATATSEKLGDVTECTFTNLVYGYYLVYQTGTKEIQSSLVSVDAAEETITLKGEAPSIEKSANKKTVEIGQVVTYTITGTIPDTTGYDTYVYKITDTLTAGLDFVEDADGKEVVNTQQYPVSVTLDGRTDQKTATLGETNNRTMTLDLSEWIRTQSEAGKVGEVFTVTYYAKVNKDAVVETKNKAELEYGNNPNDTTTTTPSEVETPTYPLRIKKTDNAKPTANRLAGAKFELYRNEMDANNRRNAIKVEGSGGGYTVSVNQNSGITEMVTIDAEVATGYNLVLNGLAAGDYWLVETEAPDGYNKLTAPVKITITESVTTDVNGWTISKDDALEGDKIIDIENSTGAILPETGGMGTILFTVVAVVLILGVVISFIRSRRKEA